MQTKQSCLALVLAAASLMAPARNGYAQSSPSPASPPQKPANAAPASGAALPVYDVATIRYAADTGSGDTHVWGRLNSLDIKNTPPLNLLTSAFDVSEDRIIGLPEWAKHARLDIDAKTLDDDTARLQNLTQTQRREMMLTLFQDRLGLKWHSETRMLPSYELIVANGGAKLKPTVATGQNNRISVNSNRFRLTNVSVPDLAVVLSGKLGRPVVDKTGLTGRYDITLEWSPDQVAAASPDAPPPLLTVLQEQLGLKVKSGTDPVQVFVIDQLTPPSAN